jgi:phosphoglycolate phosphatase
MTRLVIFDCDGTLIDSQRLIVTAMRCAFEDFTLNPPTERAILRIIGLSLPEALGRLVPAAASGQIERLVEHYKAAFFRLRSEQAEIDALYPGAGETLAGLSQAGYLLGVATGKSRRGLSATLSRHGLAGHFVTLQTADDAPSKPHPGMVERALAETATGAESAVVIGDTVFDMEMANNAGVAAIGVAWGYHDVHELRAAGAVVVVESFGDIVPAVARVFGGIMGGQR